MKDKRLSLTRIEAAAIVGLSPRQFDEAIRPRLAPAAVAGRGKSLRYDGPAVVAAFVAYRVAQATPKAIDADPFLAGAGGDSPALERYRMARAATVELELDALRRTTVRTDTLAAAMSPAVMAMRSVGERLKLDHGNDAVEIFNQGVDEFERALGDALKAAAVET